ncbi:hypothetical protein F2Q68_00039561 [Brassica cretica]|uniref:Uncharacterized protein n=1 Tax=Brassica cretica TaxID=69181 RepID=A0A8S9M9K9_BRACR|nr:hypothetical protein F2Q68_00039561 [Brassica cretica]
MESLADLREGFSSRSLLIEVPVKEQTSLEGRDGSGDAAFGNGHLLLIKAGYVISQGFRPMLEDFVEAVKCFL